MSLLLAKPLHLAGSTFSALVCVCVCPQISGVKNYDSVGLVSSAFQNGSSSMANMSPHDSLRGVTQTCTQGLHIASFPLTGTGTDLTL